MRYRVPQRLAFVLVSDGEQGAAELGLRVFLRQVPGGPNLSLSGVAALIWSVASEGEHDVAAVVSDAVDERAEGIRDEVEEYLKVLIGRGLLQVRDQT